MKKRAYVLIFFFWAFLTIITPTLVQWSAEAAAATSASKATEDEYGFSTILSTNEIKRARKMMELFPEVARRQAPSPELSLAQAPAPAPVEDQRMKKQELIHDEDSSNEVSVSRRLLQIRGRVLR